MDLRYNVLHNQIWTVQENAKYNYTLECLWRTEWLKQCSPVCLILLYKISHAEHTHACTLKKKKVGESFRGTECSVMTPELQFTHRVQSHGLSETDIPLYNHVHSNCPQPCTQHKSHIITLSVSSMNTYRWYKLMHEARKAASTQANKQNFLWSNCAQDRQRNK